MVTIEFSKEKIELLVDIIKTEIFLLEDKHQLNQWNMPTHRNEIRKKVSDLYGLLNMLKTVEPHAIPEK